MKTNIIISVIAAIAAVLHMIFPNVVIDNVTIGLLVVAVLPWLLPLLKSMEFPGGWKLEMREMKKQLDSMVAKDSEPPQATSQVNLKTLSDIETKVVKALGNPKYTWRYVRGVAAETKLQEESVRDALKSLQEKAIAVEVTGKHGMLWGLTSDGRVLAIEDAK